MLEMVILFKNANEGSEIKKTLEKFIPETTDGQL